MKTMTTGLCCLMLAVAPLALAQNINAQKKKLESPYKSKAEADKHKADTQALAECVSRARQRKIPESSPEWLKAVGGCQKDNKR